MRLRPSFYYPLLFTIGLFGCVGEPKVSSGRDAGRVFDGPPATPDTDNWFGITNPDTPIWPDVPVVVGCTGDACDSSPEVLGPVCGNGILEDGENCDDGNMRPGDGCSGRCQTEPHAICRVPGLPCEFESVCGDGVVSGIETCDDGNLLDGDGCSSICQIEPSPGCDNDGGVGCGDSGGPVVCGDGLVGVGETCDDGNLLPSDGCSATCQLEIGWICPAPGQPCLQDAYCGNGRLDPGETCDDSNTQPGDGCTGVCQRERFYECPTPGQLCVSTIVCGDGKVIGDEACDDSNKLAGDGCSANCKQVEPGYRCPNTAGVGGPCTVVPQDTCGDARLSYGETCDDGNALAGDGCSVTCKVEPGFRCPTVGQKCVRVGVCGDGKITLEAGEECDDKNAASGDGCSATCKVEVNFICPTEGQPCISTVICGDGKVTGTEACDDSNALSGDGCSACKVETGWVCPPGAACRAARCGDGYRVGTEQCDDGNTAAGDGCDSQCRLESPGPTDKDGWVCPTAGAACVRTTCGNGIVEGSEQCDDGNDDSGDGCSPFCRKEPVCPAAGGACTTSCGDGLLLPVDIANGQECDDNNTISGDGCSATCKIEKGYVCPTVQAVQDPLILPIIYRDLRGANQPNPDATHPNHPDFEFTEVTGVLQFVKESGIVENALGASGKPVHVAADKLTTNNTATYKTDGTTDWFSLWYKDSIYAKTIRSTLTFTKLASGAYQYSAPDTSGSSTDGFFPLDGQGWGNVTNTHGDSHNFHFTSEVRYWFEYKGGEQLDFVGDDDVWVFINKKLAVDLGGVHVALNGRVVLDASNGTGQVCDEVTSLDSACGAATRRTVDFGLAKGNVYEIVVFQAERHIEYSDYTLTLSNFAATRSSCQTVCGDGIVTPNEACDLGTTKNTGAYGTCNLDCSRPSYCGDGVPNSPQEQCDDGENLATYGGISKKCAPKCIWAPYCGDSKADTAYGEACDEGANNGKGYGHCTATCGIGPRCGDGLTTDAEECDHGAQNGMPGDGCSTTCTLRCGNGVVDSGEQCDNGKAANTGGYGKCKADCTLDIRCGDGFKNGTEECDDGVNDGSYGNCAPGCVLGPRCGDGKIQSLAREVCDQGPLNLSVAVAYGKDKCTTLCQPAPYCGNKAVDGIFGEKCDDGVNSGLPGSCTVDCTAFVPLPSCGDGILLPPEVCDDGAKNGTLASLCDIHCRLKCGNGFRDAGEECDDGVNNGSYGTCLPNCKLADYCGDGIKNGPEACDLGAANEANPYGPGKCSTLCAVAPYCGNGRIESAFGEECEGGLTCTVTCLKINNQ